MKLFFQFIFLFFPTLVFSADFSISNASDAYTNLPLSVSNNDATNTVTFDNGTSVLLHNNILQPILVDKGKTYIIKTQTAGTKATINGADGFRGLIILPASGSSGTATVNISDIAFFQCFDIGGSGSGGGLGAGAGIFVGSGNNVTLTNASFTSCTATGGAAVEELSLGGGGMSRGSSVSAETATAPGKGGGGLGTTAGNPIETGGSTGGGGIGGNADDGYSGSGTINVDIGGGGGGSGGFASGQTAGEALGNPRWGTGGGTGGNLGVSGDPGSYGGGGGGGLSNTPNLPPNGGSVTEGPGGGGGGGSADSPSENIPGNGGDGGFGSGGGGAGGGGTGLASGGNGGFGGGGGASGESRGMAGNGGFGAGGGYTGGSHTPTSGFGAGEGQGGGGGALGGAIFIQDGGALTISGTCLFTGNSVVGGEGINSNNGIAAGTDIFIMSGGQFTFDSSENLGILTRIEGNQGAGGGTPSNGSFTKSGTGTLTLAANNTFDGALTLNNGTLSTPEESGLGVSPLPVTLAGGTLEITTGSDPLSKTYNVAAGGTTISTPSGVTLDQSPDSGKFSAATGKVTKAGSGTLVLTRSTNRFDGDFDINAGIVIASPTSIPAPTITNNATLIFDIEGTNTFSNEIAGTGGITQKDGAGTLDIASGASFSANNSIEVLEGYLNLKSGSNLAGNQITVKHGAFLTGVGTVTPGTQLTNKGTITPGNSIGTVTVSGDYVQSASGKLHVEINNAAQSDLVDISGTAALDGTLQLTPDPGIYSTTTDYTILDADGGVSGTFASFTHTNELDLSVRYLANSVVIRLNSPGVVTPKPIAQLINNEKVVANYLFCAPDTLTGDLFTVREALLDLVPEEFREALLKVSSQIYGAFPLTNMRSSVQIMENLSSMVGCSCDRISITPFGSFYEQRGVWSQFPFDASTYGFTLHGDHEWTSYLCAGLFATYSYSRIFWDQNIALSHLNNIYAGPYAKFNYEEASFFLSIAGAWNQASTHRNIVFTGINRTAKSSQSGGSLFIEAALGYDVPLTAMDALFRMDGGGLYGVFWEPSIRETGADSINLFIDSDTMQFIVPYVEFSFSKDFWQDRLSPRIYIGWEGLFNLSKNYNHSTFSGNALCRPYMDTASYNQNTNELTLGGDLTLKKIKEICFNFGYEFKVGNNFWTQQGHFQLGFSY